MSEKRVLPYPDIESITIRDGREAELLVCTGDDAPSAELRMRIREALIIPEQSWFSYGEQVYLNRSLAGHFAEQVDDRYYFVAIDEEIIGATWVGRGRNHPEIGSLGYVYSHPHFRRQGIGSSLFGAQDSKLFADQMQVNLFCLVCLPCISPITIATE